MHDERFRCMGTDVRLLISDDEGLRPAAVVAREARAWLEAYEAALSRFREDSELSALNADPRREVPASPMLQTAVVAAVRAAAMTGGLVDPTLGRAIVAAGYGASRSGVPPEPLTEALAAAPPRRPATPDPARRWTAVRVDRRRGTVIRPPDVVIDTGGSGKGLAADALARRLGGRSLWAVDCGGDVRLGGVHEVVVDHPLGGGPAHVMRVDGGAVATSGLGSRLWRRQDGAYAHHLLDPATGQPAWTGLISATALAPTGLEAEALAKLALLGGARRARVALLRHGGVVVHESGEVETIGLSGRRMRVTLPRGRAA